MASDIKGGYLIYGSREQLDVIDAVSLLEEKGFYYQVVDIYKGWVRTADDGADFYQICFIDREGQFKHLGSLANLKISLGMGPGLESCLKVWAVWNEVDGERRLCSLWQEERSARAEAEILNNTVAKQHILIEEANKKREEVLEKEEHATSREDVLDLWQSFDEWLYQRKKELGGIRMDKIRGKFIAFEKGVYSENQRAKG